MAKRLPTLLLFGIPENQTLLKTFSNDLGLGVTIDNGLARDPVFSFYESISRADAIIAFSNAHPVHLTSLIAEGEVGHPLLLQERVEELNSEQPFPLKPIIFFGNKKQWQPFREVFRTIRKEGLIRNGFDRVVHYSSHVDDTIQHLSECLPQEVRSTRIDYYLHAKKAADLSFEYRKDVKPQSAITLSFFGSATTKDSAHLERVQQAARACARNNWNILHGGGDAGVMGELSRAGKEAGAYVFGISVDFTGAPKIYFEKKNDFDKLDELDYYVSSKDMLHRIETYAGYSEAFIALDGGIGSIQEILVIAELLDSQHPAVTFLTKDKLLVPKPLYVVNESEIYSPLLEYLNHHKYHYLKEHIKELDTVAEVEITARNYFKANPPMKKSLNEKVLFRNNYHTSSEPRESLKRSLSGALRAQDPIELTSIGK